MAALLGRSDTLKRFNDASANINFVDMNRRKGESGDVSGKEMLKT